MRNLNFGSNLLSLLSVVFILPLILFHETIAQEHDLNEDIEKHRKGELIIQAKAGDQVTVEQLGHEFWFGAAISNGMVSGSMAVEDVRQYREKFLENFNSAVTENALKWPSMEPKKGEVNYAVVDGILTWTEENNIPLRGHNLFWGIEKFVQPWVMELDDAELKETIKNRAQTIASKYKGRFAEYDLNNEMVHGNYYKDRLGPEITKWMAEWAQEGDPDAELYLNDYNILTGKSLSGYMSQIRDLLNQGVPIAGIGVQGHSHGETFDRELLKQALDSLAIFGLPIRVTEFNMPGQNSRFHRENIREMKQQEEELKAQELVDFYRICFSHPAVSGILMWGFWEGANWIPVSSLYSKNWTPTPAAIAYQNLVWKEWWTQRSGSVGGEGVYVVPAFYGRYRITVNGISKEVDLKKKEGKTVVDFRDYLKNKVL